MIAKTGTGKGFSGLMEYLIDRKKFEWMETRNVTSIQPDTIAREMQIYSMESRAKKPVYHVTISWDPADEPTKKEMVEVGEGFLKHMGLDSHQAVMVSHSDGNHPHMHLIINRVHPESGKAWESFDYQGLGRDRKIVKREYEKIEEFLRNTEKEKGWRFVPGKHTEHGKEFDFESPAPDVWEIRRERQLKEKTSSLGFDPEWIDPRSPKQKAIEIKEALLGARSFEELDGQLARVGLWLEKKGQGAVITDGYLSVKLSTISRELSTGNLENKFNRKLSDYITYREQGVDLERGSQEVSRALKLTFEIELDRSEIITKNQLRVINNELSTLHTSPQVDNIVKDIQKAFKNGFEEGEHCYTVFMRYSKRVGLERAYQHIATSPQSFGEIKDNTHFHMLVNNLRSFREVNDLANHHIGELLASDRKQRLIRKKTHYQNAYANIVNQSATLNKQTDRLTGLLLSESEAGRDVLHAKNKTAQGVKAVRNVIGFHKAFREHATTGGTTLSKQIAQTIGGPKTRIAMKVLESSSMMMLQATKNIERSR
ncbi:MAG: relaxase/mobilization nuclease domain-containing protein [Balneolaceae bacterium]|nr:relaxase/mobilization nuclease domain-containing protein [Balneolaceae bacterium]